MISFCERNSKWRQPDPIFTIVCSSSCLFCVSVLQLWMIRIHFLLIIQIFLITTCIFWYFQNKVVSINFPYFLAQNPLVLRKYGVTIWKKNELYHLWTLRIMSLKNFQRFREVEASFRQISRRTECLGLPQS